MGNSPKKFQPSRTLRKQHRERRSLERWEQIRAEGQARFILRSALTFSLTMIGASDVFDHIFYGGARSSTFLSGATFYLVGGIFVGVFGWSSMEAKYKNALIEATLKASPSGNLPPQDSPLQITADPRSK